jgi:hypothetical protein
VALRSPCIPALRLGRKNSVNGLLRAPAAFNEFEHRRMKVVAGRPEWGDSGLPHGVIMQQSYAAKKRNLFSLLILLRIP